MRGASARCGARARTRTVNLGIKRGQKVIIPMSMGIHPDLERATWSSQFRHRNPPRSTGVAVRVAVNFGRLGLGAACCGRGPRITNPEAHSPRRRPAFGTCFGSASPLITWHDGTSGPMPAAGNWAPRWLGRSALVRLVGPCLLERDDRDWP